MGILVQQVVRVQYEVQYVQGLCCLSSKYEVRSNVPAIFSARVTLALATREKESLTAHVANLSASLSRLRNIENIHTPTPLPPPIPSSFTPHPQSTMGVAKKTRKFGQVALPFNPLSETNLSNIPRSSASSANAMRASKRTPTPPPKAKRRKKPPSFARSPRSPRPSSSSTIPLSCRPTLFSSTRISYRIPFNASFRCSSP